VAGDLLADVGLADRARSPIASYSRGMRQRLGIARSLVNDPTVIFLDEPTLGLDPSGQQHVLDLIRGIARQRRATVVLSTHTLPDVEAVCSRVLILNGGRLVASGSVRDVIRTVAAPRTCRIRVPAEHAEAAVQVLGDVPGLLVTATDADPGALVVTTWQTGTPGEATSAALNAALHALSGSTVPVLSFEAEGARLSDAFLAMTDPTAQ
jgi:ABC-2 type transport system ATP-binding protein